MARLLLTEIKKWYGATLANSIDRLEVPQGEVLSLLGPSGCGKTTTLRIIAGLIRQDQGDVYFSDSLMNDVPPEKRNTAMVFQNYALFPHMNVFENVAFGLRVRGLPHVDIQKKVSEALDMVRLSDLSQRLPNALSGGQQQRVALARAVVIGPDLLLFDEPLSNLDARLREEMRFELREFLNTLKLTSVYVTHDQAEAIVLSDKIAVMENGRIQQFGNALTLYDAPASKFVASFMGQAKFIPGKVTELCLDQSLGRITTPEGIQIWTRADGFAIGENALAAVRPEAVRLYPVGENMGERINVFPGMVERTTPFGDHTDYVIRLGQWEIQSKVLSSENNFRPGSKVMLVINPRQCALVADAEQS